MWGTLYYVILLPIFQHVKCTASVCPDGVLDDTAGAFRQMADNSTILILCFAHLISVACFNGTGVAITKYASAAQRSTIDTCRTLVIWLVQIMRGKEHFLWSEVGGFVLLVAGTLIYNEIVIVPFELMSRNTRREMAKRESESILDEDVFPESVKKEANYLATSPAAGYDSNRMMRNLKQ
jgi:hypothetical protein